MALKPISTRLRNVSNGLAKVYISVAPGDEIEVPEDVAAQIAHQRAPLRDESVPVPGPKVTEPLPDPAADLINEVAEAVDVATSATAKKAPAKKAPAKKAPAKKKAAGLTVADPYLDPDGVRSRVSSGSPVLAEDDFDDDWVAEQVAVWEAILEDYTGDAYVVRERTVTTEVKGCTTRLVLPVVHITEIVSVTVDGDEIEVDEHQPELALGVVRYSGGFRPGTTIAAEVEYGHEEMPAVIPVVTAMYVERMASLDRAGSTPDVSRQGFDGGSTVYVQPDPANGKLTGFREIDRLVNSLPRYKTPGIA